MSDDILETSEDIRNQRTNKCASKNPVYGQVDGHKDNNKKDQKKEEKKKKKYAGRHAHRQTLHIEKT